MGAPIFPDLGRSLVTGLQARSMIDQQDQEQRRRGLAPDVQSALGGDSGALGRIAAVDPDYAIKLGPILDKLDADKQAVLKRAADFTVQAGMGVMNAPQEMRPQAYAAAMAEAQRMRIPTDKWPQQWGPQAEGFLTFNVNKAIPVAKWFEEREKTARETLTPSGGGVPGPATAGGAPGGGGPAPNQQQFIQTMMPHALAVSQATGLDPRMVLAQSALETGFGASAPGNNYFGIKGGNGPPMATTEAGPGGALVPAQASFRSYPDAGSSAQDYVQFIKGNQGRYAPVMQAQGLDAQIDAMAKSGYATDPQYGAKLRAIAQSLPPMGGPQPTTGTPPPELVAQGANAAPMPSVSPQQAGATPGPPPAQMPSPPAGMVAQAGGPPVMPPQGGGDASGNPMQVGDQFRDLQSKLPPGYRLAMQGRQMAKAPDGYVAVFPPGSSDPRSVTYVEVPKPQQTQKPTPPTGMRFTPQGGVEWLPGYQEAQEGLARSKRELKAIPAAENDKLSMNVSLIGSIDKALEAYGDGGKPSGRFAGTLSQYGGGAGRQIAQTIDKEGQPARAAIANVASTLLQARSGLAVTEGEYNRLAEMLPQASDDPDIIRSKLKDIRDTYSALTKDQAAQYSEKNGYIAHSGVQSLGGGKAPKQGAADQGRLLFDARKAIEQGAPRDAVLKELKDKYGIEGGL